MVNSTIADYLKRYGDKYKLEDLKKQIISKGYTEVEFNETLNFFRNEKQKKKYSVNPLPTQKLVAGKKKFGWLKLILVLFGILIFTFGFVVLFNYMGMSFYGWNIFGYG